MRLLPRAAKLKNPCQCNSTCLSGCQKIRLQEGLSLLARFASTSAGSGLTATQFLATTSALTGAWVAVLVFSTLSSSAPQIQLRIPRQWWWTRFCSLASSSPAPSTHYGVPAGAGGAMTLLSWNCRGSGGSLSSHKMTHLAHLITTTKS